MPGAVHARSQPVNLVASSRRLCLVPVTPFALFCLSLCLLPMVGCGGGGSVATASPNTASAGATLSPTAVDFGEVALGSQGSAQITIRNSGLNPVSVSAVAVTGQDFNTTGLALPLEIPVGQSSSFGITFSPQATGKTSGSLSVLSDASPAPLQASLSGTGITRQLTATPGTISFGQVATGDHKTQSVTLSSTGTANVQITQAKVAGTGFSISGLSLPMTLAAGQTTTFTAEFSPGASGNATGSVSLSTNAAGPPVSVVLTGSGVAGSLVASTPDVNFGSIRVGSTGTQAVTLTNVGTAAVTITSSTISGSGFSVTGLALPLTLSPGGATSFNAVFAPTSAASASGSVSFNGDAVGSPTVVSLTGTGSSFQISVSPGSLSFGNVAVGSGANQQVTLTNTGTASVTVTQATVSGTGYSLSGLALPVVLAAGQSTNFSAVFSPTAGGTARGSISVISNASNSPTVASLSGVGQTLQLSVSPGVIGFGDAAIGTTDSQTVTLTNTGTSSITVSQATVAGSGFSLSGLALPLVLAAGQQTNFSAAFSPTTTGDTTGSISIVSSASNTASSVALSGTGVTLQLAPSPGSLSFGNVTVNSSQTQSVSLKNTGTSTVLVTQATVTGSGFSISGLTLPLTLAGGQSAGFSATFAPGTSGTATGSISVVSNASNSPAVVSLSGTGVTLQLSVSPLTLAFGNVNVGATSTQTVTLTNAGTGAVTVSAASVTGSGFSLSGLTLPFTLGAGEHTSLSASFAPTVGGNATGSLSITSNASSSASSVALSGTGATLQVSVLPGSIGFGNVTVGTKSTQQDVTLTNSGTGSVTVSQATVTGASFSISGPTLPLTLTGGQNTTFKATFSPTTATTATGSISIASTASNSPATVALSGTGVTLQLSVSASTVVFGDVGVSTTGTQSLTLTNSGTGSVTVSQAPVTGTGFSTSGLTLPLTLSGGQSTGFSALFSPTTTGSATGSISITSTASNSPASVSLSGTGVTLQISLAPPSVTFGNVTLGSSSSQPVIVTNSGTGSITISEATVTGSGFSTTDLSLPLTLTAGTATSFNAIFSPSATGSASGAIALTSNATGSPSSISLSGSGVHSVSLSWTASTSLNILGYNVYKGTVSGGPYTLANSSLVSGTTYTDTSVQAGQTYYYVSTAVNSSDEESAYSNEAEAVVPSP